MGLYDTFVYACPHCGKTTSAQTKLGECLLLTLGIGSSFPLTDSILRMKNKCEHCGLSAAAVVKEGKITSFVDADKATMSESLWGTIEDVGEKK